LFHKFLERIDCRNPLSGGRAGRGGGGDEGVGRSRFLKFPNFELQTERLDLLEPILSFRNLGYRKKDWICLCERERERGRERERKESLISRIRQKLHKRLVQFDSIELMRIRNPFFTVTIYDGAPDFNSVVTAAAKLGGGGRRRRSGVLGGR
jgi:hypothetical protein